MGTPENVVVSRQEPPDLWSLSDSCCLKCLKARSSMLWMNDSGTGWTESRGITSTSTRQKRNSTASSLRSTRCALSFLLAGNGESVVSLREKRV